MGKFERGFFEFYSSDKKRDLYYKGRRYGDYRCVKPDFIGRFPKPYLVDEKKYRAKKYEDMLNDDDISVTPIIRKEERIETYKRIKEVLEEKKIKIGMRSYGKMLGLGHTSIVAYEKEISKENALKVSSAVII